MNKYKEVFDPEVYEFYKPALEGPGFDAPFTVDDIEWLREDEVKRHAAHTDPYEVFETFDKFIQRPAGEEGNEESGDADPLMVRVYIPKSVHDMTLARKAAASGKTNAAGQCGVAAAAKTSAADNGGAAAAKTSAADNAAAAGKISAGAPVLLYFHGGGYVMGCVDDHDPLCGKLADACEAVVISVEYRLAPEHPFPACIDDAVLAADWAYKNARKFGGDPDKLMAGGDSSGANISAVLALLGKAGKAPKLSYLILFYGVYGCIDLADSESAKEFGQGGFVLPVNAMNEMMKIYLPDGADPEDIRVAPGLAEDLSGMPPAVIVSAEFDPLRDDGEEFARRLEKAGNDVELIRMDGMMHGFILYYQRFHRAEELLEKIGEGVKARFA